MDDEVATRSLLRRLFDDFFPDVHLIWEAESVTSGTQMLQASLPDLLLLDIQLRDGNGFDLLNQFPEPGFQVVFITAYDQFALRAFQYNAIDYLLKPLDPRSLREAIDKLRKQKELALRPRLNGLMEVMENRQAKKIALSSAEGYSFYDLEEIIRLESSGNYTTFYILDGQKTTVAKTIKEYEELLPEHLFFRVHQSHIVSLQHVRKFLKADNGIALMADGFKAPVARRKKETFLQLLTRHTL